MRGLVFINVGKRWLRLKYLSVFQIPPLEVSDLFEDTYARVEHPTAPRTKILSAGLH